MTLSEQKQYQKIKKYYVKVLKESPDMVDLLADYDILRLIVSGMSNKSISISLDIDEKDIVESSLKYYSFPGWEKDLDFNPLMVYTRYRTKEAFYEQVFLISPLDLEKIEQIYNVCEKFDEIRKVIK